MDTVRRGAGQREGEGMRYQCPECHQVVEALEGADAVKCMTCEVFMVAKAGT